MARRCRSNSVKTKTTGIVGDGIDNAHGPIAVILDENNPLTCLDPAPAPAFKEAVTQAVPLFQQTRHTQSSGWTSPLRHPLEYTLTVAWATVEDHTVGSATPKPSPNGENSLVPPLLKHQG